MKILFNSFHLKIDKEKIIKFLRLFLYEFIFYIKKIMNNINYYQDIVSH